MPTLQARIIHRTIARDWRAVYAFAAKPENMPLWASGLAAGLTREGDDWIADGGPVGNVRVRFAPSNDFGVIDHTVTLPNGLMVENALRIVPNGDGAEAMFTLLRQPDTDDAAFESDAAHIARDLDTLKKLMEQETRAMSTGGADHKIDYIEFNVADIPRSRAFYGDAFGWTFTDYGPDYCEFQDGRLTGGFTTLAPVKANGGPLIILFADDLEDALARVQAAGGNIIKPIFEFPGGRRFQFTDPDGYELGVWSDG